MLFRRKHEKLKDLIRPIFQFATIIWLFQLNAFDHMDEETNIPTVGKAPTPKESGFNLLSLNSGKLLLSVHAEHPRYEFIVSALATIAHIWSLNQSHFRLQNCNDYSHRNLL